MPVPKSLATQFSGIASLERRIILSREDMKRGMASFYGKFTKKYPKATTADFARQFDKSVGFKRDAYKRNATYNAIENMFRYMPEVKTGGKAESVKAKKARIDAAKTQATKRKAQATAKANRAARLLCAICHQAGIPNALFTIAAQRCGFTSSEIEAIWNTKGGLVDVGLGTFQLTVRKSGVAATVALAKDNVKVATAAKSIPTAAEVASQAKAKPTVTTVESPLKNAPTVPPVYKGKGQYQRTIKRGDNLSARA
jgi:hypothetical protein